MTAQLSLLNPEEVVRDQVLDQMEESELRAYYLELIRERMRERWQWLSTVSPGEAFVTPDDARIYFERLCPPPPGELSRNFLGCVFRGEEWEFAGTYKSRTSGSHANRLNRYRYIGGDNGHEDTL